MTGYSTPSRLGDILEEGGSPHTTQLVGCNVYKCWREGMQTPLDPTVPLRAISPAEI